MFATPGFMISSMSLGIKNFKCKWQINETRRQGFFELNLWFLLVGGPTQLNQATPLLSRMGGGERGKTPPPHHSGVVLFPKVVTPKNPPTRRAPSQSSGKGPKTSPSGREPPKKGDIGVIKCHINSPKKEKKCTCSW